MLVRAVDDGEEVLAVIYTSFTRVIQVYCIYTIDEVAGEAALYTINSVEYSKKV
jgi:hypothetical protein